MGRRRSLKAEQAALAEELRASGTSWTDIAAIFRERYGLSARAAMRKVRGWSQQRAAEEWTRLWPDDPKDAKSFSHLERWPNGGHPPSIHKLDRLARLYQCDVADLLVDLAGYRRLDPHAHGSDSNSGTAHTGQFDSPTEDLAAVPPGGRPGPVRGEIIPSGTDCPDSIDIDELAQGLVAWAGRSDSTSMGRRDLLTKLSAALASAAIAPLIMMGDREGRERLRQVSLRPERVDLATLGHYEAIVLRCRRQADVLGPEVGLQTALAQRASILRILPVVPSQLRSQGSTTG